eukprot:jgi/Bigna1/63312/fgenesh1_kg.50_\
MVLCVRSSNKPASSAQMSYAGVHIGSLETRVSGPFWSRKVASHIWGSCALPPAARISNCGLQEGVTSC